MDISLTRLSRQSFLLQSILLSVNVWHRVDWCLKIGVKNVTSFRLVQQITPHKCALVFAASQHKTLMNKEESRGNNRREAKKECKRATGYQGIQLPCQEIS